MAGVGEEKENSSWLEQAKGMFFSVFQHYSWRHECRRDATVHQKGVLGWNYMCKS